LISTRSLGSSGLSFVRRARRPIPWQQVIELSRWVLGDAVEDVGEPRLRITSPEFPGERLIVCRNPDLARERAR
jgi:hypothetical protein